jgi:hypothetical protein
MNDNINDKDDDSVSSFPHGDDKNDFSSPSTLPLNQNNSQNHMRGIVSTNLFEQFPPDDINVDDCESGHQSPPLVLIITLIFLDPILNSFVQI